MKKALVAYFSATGVTAAVARNLADAAGADLFEIKPEVPYTAEDLNWQNQHSRSSLEMHDRTKRPALSAARADIAAYDTVFLGFPIWWYIAPTIVNAFLESYDFSGKTIILFATSSGSSIDGSARALKASVSPSAKMVTGKILNGRPSASVLQEWVNTLHLD